MNNEEFVKLLHQKHEEFEKTLNAVGIKRMHIVGVSGFYSTKDIVAHVTAYEQALVKWLKEARANRVYIDPVLDQPDLDARNAIIYEANKNLDASEILSNYRQTFDELIEQVSLFTDQELVDPDAVYVIARWQRKQELWTCIANDSYEHQEQHIPDIEKWCLQTKFDE